MSKVFDRATLSVNGMKKVEGLDFGVEPPGIQFCRVGSPASSRADQLNPFYKQLPLG